QPVAAAKLVRAALVTFHPPEDRQHVLIAPAAVAELGPVVVILRLAAHIDHAVDRARSAHHLAARHVDAASARTFVGLGLVAPVHGGIVDHLGGADRHPRPEMVRSLGARFQQQYAIGAALAQPACDHRAGRTRADHDVVIGGVVSHGTVILLLMAGFSLAAGNQ